MIIGIISPLQNHVQIIESALPTELNYVKITEEDLVKFVGVGAVINNDKCNLLTELQRIYGNVLISGDTLWDEKACHHLLSVLHGLLLIDTTPLSPDELPSGQYWKRDEALENVAWRRQLVVTHETEFLDYLNFSTKEVQWHIKSLVELIKRHDDRKVVTNLSMEDVIKRAMQELGIDSQDIEPIPLVTVPSSHPQGLVCKPFETAKTVAEEEVTESPDEELIDSSEQQRPLEETEEQLSTDNTEPKNYELPPADRNLQGGIKVRSVDDPLLIKENFAYLKIKDGTIALLLPASFQLPTQSIEGKEYQVLVFTAPNLGDTGLQELKIQNQIIDAVNQSRVDTKSSVKRQSIISQEKIVAENADDLQQLVAQKVHLDQLIKSARAAKDDATVAELRKQRRSIRRQINAIGGGMDNATS